MRCTCNFNLSGSYRDLVCHSIPAADLGQFKQFWIGSDALEALGTYRVFVERPQQFRMNDDIGGGTIADALPQTETVNMDRS